MRVFVNASFYKVITSFVSRQDNDFQACAKPVTFRLPRNYFLTNFNIA